MLCLRGGGMHCAPCAVSEVDAAVHQWQAAVARAAAEAPPLPLPPPPQQQQQRAAAGASALPSPPPPSFHEALHRAADR